jgi:hypothetical protein
MADVTVESDIEQLTALNARLAAAERDCDVATMEPILDAEFRFRRGDGSIVDRHEFLTDLVKPENRNEILTADIESIDVRGVQAVVIAMVTFSGRRGDDRISGLFRNIRLFERTGTGWSLVMWFNKRVGDLTADR